MRQKSKLYDLTKEELEHMAQTKSYRMMSFALNCGAKAIKKRLEELNIQKGGGEHEITK